MALRAKKPVKQPQRFKALIYAREGVGKSHFACSIPHCYYIDSEDLEQYENYVDMLIANKSDLVHLTSLEEIVAEIQDLSNQKDIHDYKTVVIDSITKPYIALADVEAERLRNKKDKENSEGTGFAKNFERPKRLINQLSRLVLRLDMNVIVLAQAKAKFKKGEEEGDTYDVHEKMSYDLGVTLELKKLGKKRIGFVKKTKYKQFPEGETIDLTDGYQTLKEMFGEEIFLRKSLNEAIATPEQVEQLKHFVNVLKIEEEILNKWYTASKSTCFEEMSEKDAKKYIDACNKKITTKSE